MRLTSSCLILLCVALSACENASDGDNGSVGAISLFDPTAANPSLCGAPAIPFPNDALFADAASPTGITQDTTLNIGSSASTAVAANLTDGWSTTASAFTDVLGLVDYATAGAGVVIIEADATPRILQAGTDYTVQPSIAMATLSGTGGCALDATVNSGAARFLPISQQRSRLLIEPLKPLNPSTTYLVAVTSALKSLDGVSARPGEFFTALNRSAKLCRLSSGETTSELLCSAAGAPAAAAAATGLAVFNTLTAPTPNPAGGAPLTGASAAAVRMTTLETLRRNLVFPTVAGIKTLSGALGAPIADSDLVVAWKFTTQSVGKTLGKINATATAKTFSVSDTTLTTGMLDLNGDGNPGDLPDTAKIFAGALLSVPYYLDDASGTHDIASQGGFWLSDGTRDTTAVVAALNNTSCDAAGPFSGKLFAPSVSTTNCFPTPTVRSTENLPVIITVPKTAKPTGGWPVVIFQHGITGNRTQMLPLGATLAGAGFVTVAIDLPLHGVMPGAGFYAGAGNERTFDLDISAASAGNACGSAPGGDGATDPSGTCFINLGSLATSRDNLRQAVADLVHLTRSLQAADPMNLDAASGDDINHNRIFFAGMSLGGIVGGTFLGVDTGATATADETDEAILAGVLNVPGGGVARLLDASASFGPVIAAGLAGGAITGDLAGGASPFEGTDTYETFIRFAQQLVDPGDPINYAVSANANHPVLVQEVIGDTVVPNSAFTNCPAASALTPGIGAVATANTPNSATRTAACLASIALAGTNQATAVACNNGSAATGVCTATASQDETLHSSYLAGTDPLYGLMGLSVIGPITPPTQCAKGTGATGLDSVVQFATGAHSSLLSPAGGVAVTAEMQREVTYFFLSDGNSVTGGSCT